MQFERNEMISKLLYGTFFSALTASFVVLFTELISKKNKREVRNEEVKEEEEEEEEGSNNNENIKKKSLKKKISARKCPDNRDYRLEKDG